MIVIGQGLNRVFDMALTTKKNDDAWKLSSELYDIDRSDENLAGTQRGDMLKVSRVIADVLLDSAKSAGETEVKEAWKNVFGVELAASWFDIVGTGGKLPDGTQLTPLKNQSPSRSTLQLEASVKCTSSHIQLQSLRFQRHGLVLSSTLKLTQMGNHI